MAVAEALESPGGEVAGVAAESSERSPQPSALTDVRDSLHLRVSAMAACLSTSGSPHAQPPALLAPCAPFRVISHQRSHCRIRWVTASTPLPTRIRSPNPLAPRLARNHSRLGAMHSPLDHQHSTVSEPLRPRRNASNRFAQRFEPLRPPNHNILWSPPHPTTRYARPPVHVRRAQRFGTLRRQPSQPSRRAGRLGRLLPVISRANHDILWSPPRSTTRHPLFRGHVRDAWDGWDACPRINASADFRLPTAYCRLPTASSWPRL